MLLVPEEVVVAAQDGHRRRRNVGGGEDPVDLELVEASEAEGQFRGTKSESCTNVDDVNAKKSNSVDIQIPGN